MAPYKLENLQQEFDLSGKTAERLQIYADLLTKWQTRINLIGRKTVPELWDRHFRDSIQLKPFMTDIMDIMDIHDIWIDVGSGAGFPGLVLAILQSDMDKIIPVHLIESDQRKTIFLGEVIRATQAPAIVHNQRIERLEKNDFEGPVCLITARALAPLHEILTLTEKLRENTTKYLLLKGQDVDRELTQTSKYMKMRLTTHPSRTDPAGRVLEITEVSRV